MGKDKGLPQMGARFIVKLYKMLAEEHNSQAICWDSNGLSFIVKDKEALVDQVLPQFFRHQTYKFFLRQLKSYGFARTKSGPLCDVFTHPNFRRDCWDQLRFINREIEKRQPSCELISAHGRPSESSEPIFNQSENQQLSQKAQILAQQERLKLMLKSISLQNQVLRDQNRALVRCLQTKISNQEQLMRYFLIRKKSSKRACGQNDQENTAAEYSLPLHHNRALQEILQKYNSENSNGLNSPNSETFSSCESSIFE